MTSGHKGSDDNGMYAGTKYVAINRLKDITLLCSDKQQTNNESSSCRLVSFSAMLDYWFDELKTTMVIFSVAGVGFILYYNLQYGKEGP